MNPSRTPTTGRGIVDELLGRDMIGRPHVTRANSKRTPWPSSSAGQPDNIELRTLVRVAAALGAHLDVSIRPSGRTGRKARSHRGSVWL